MFENVSLTFPSTRQVIKINDVPNNMVTLRCDTERVTPLTAACPEQNCYKHGRAGVFAINLHIHSTNLFFEYSHIVINELILTASLWCLQMNKILHLIQKYIYTIYQ